jgi:hypothetical protein
MLRFARTRRRGQDFIEQTQLWFAYNHLSTQLILSPIEMFVLSVLQQSETSSTLTFSTLVRRRRDSFCAGTAALVQLGRTGPHRREILEPVGGRYIATISLALEYAAT